MKRRTSKKKFRQKVAALKDWFRTQLTTPIVEVWPVLNQKLRGHYQYYHVNDNWQYVSKYREAAHRLGHRSMRRRSQKGQTRWELLTNWLKHHPLAVPGKVTDLIAMARAET